MKNSNDAIGNRTRDFPACSVIPQIIAPPPTPTAGIKPMLNRLKDFVLWEDIINGRFCDVKSFHGHYLSVAATDCRKSGRHKYHIDCIYDKILVDFIG